MLSSPAPPRTAGDALNPLLYAALAETFGSSWPHYDECRDLRRALQESHRYQREAFNHFPSPCYDTDEEAAAYFLGYLPRNYLKARHILAALPDFARTGSVNILDVGAGPGTMSLGAIDALAGHDTPGRDLREVAVSVTFVDRSAAMLKLATCALTARASATEARTGLRPRVTHHLPVTGDFCTRETVEHLACHTPFDLVAFGSCLCENLNIDELSPPCWGSQASDIVSAYLPLLARNGYLLVIERAFRPMSDAVEEMMWQILGSNSGLKAVAWSRCDRLPSISWGTAPTLSVEILGEDVRKGLHRGSPYTYFLLRKDRAA